MTMDAAIEAMAVEIGHHRVHSDGGGLPVCDCGWRPSSDDPSPATHTARFALDALTSQRTVECETCGGKGYDDELGDRHEDWVPCSGCDDGRIEKGPIAYLAGDFEQAGTLTEDYIDGEWRGRIAGYMTTNAIATRTVPLLRVRPDESPKGGA